MILILVTGVEFYFIDEGGRLGELKVVSAPQG